jgi:ATP-dependent DNA helicase RecG
VGVEDDGTVSGARPRHEAGRTDPLRVQALIANMTQPALSAVAGLVQVGRGAVDWAGLRIGEATWADLDPLEFERLRRQSGRRAAATAGSGGGATGAGACAWRGRR